MPAPSLPTLYIPSTPLLVQTAGVLLFVLLGETYKCHHTRYELVEVQVAFVYVDLTALKPKGKIQQKIKEQHMFPTFSILEQLFQLSCLFLYTAVCKLSRDVLFSSYK